MRTRMLMVAAFVPLLFCSCNNLYHGINQIPLLFGSQSVFPMINFCYPADGETRVAPNQALLVSFNKSIDASSINNDQGLIGASADGVEIIAEKNYPKLVQGRIIVFRPFGGFKPGKLHKIIIKKNIRDTEGLVFPMGHAWSFSVTDEMDAEPPYVKSVDPGNGNFYVPGEGIRIKFNEPLDPESLDVKNNPSFDFLLSHEKGGLKKDISCSCRYLPSESVLSCRPTAEMRGNTEYTARIGGVKDLAGNVMEGAYSWKFSTTAIETGMMDAHVIDGRGTFGKSQNGNGQRLCDDRGRLIYGLEYNGKKRFLYGDSMSEIFDEGADGEFDPGKYLCLTVNGENIMSGPLKMEPLSYNLGDGYYSESPLAGKCYIDPVTGVILLPRPVFWHRFDLIEFLDIGYDNSFNYRLEGLGLGYSLMKFGDGVGISNSLFPSYGILRIYPYSILGCVLNVKKLTLSAYIRQYGSEFFTNKSGGMAEINIGEFKVVRIETGLISPGSQHVFKLFDQSGNEYDSWGEVDSNGKLYHIYIVLDSDSKLKEDKSIRVFINGIERLKYSGTKSWNYGGVNIVLYGGTEAVSLEGSSYIDNLKIWNDVVSQDPSWEYNDGKGREDAMHVIYGEKNDYKPKEVKCGYYYVP